MSCASSDRSFLTQYSAFASTNTPDSVSTARSLATLEDQKLEIERKVHLIPIFLFAQL